METIDVEILGRLSNTTSESDSLYVMHFLRSIADTMDVQRVKQMFQSAEPIAFRPLHQHPQTLTASDDLRASFESIARHIDRFYTEPRTLTPEQALPQTIKNIARRLGAYTD